MLSLTKDCVVGEEEGEVLRGSDWLDQQGRDSGASSSQPSLVLSLERSLVKEVLRNLGMIPGDLTGEEGDVTESNTPRLRLSRLRVFFFKAPVGLPVTSSTEEEDDMNSLLRNRFSCHESVGVVGTEELGKLNFGILGKLETRGRLELSFFSLEDNLTFFSKYEKYNIFPARNVFENYSLWSIKSYF